MNFVLELVYALTPRRGWFGLSIGGAACLLFYWGLASASMSHHEGPSVAFVLAIEVAIIAMFTTGIGRTFSVGFISVIVPFAIASRGLMLIIPWGMPVIAAYEAVSHVQVHHDPPTVSRAAWLKTRRATPPALAQGQILTNAVNECARRYRGNDLHDSYPHDVSEAMLMDCDTLASTRVGQSVSKFSPTDYGWRWAYDPGSPDSAGRITDYRVRVFEDPAIGRASPQYTSDTTGAIRQLVAGKAPVFVATPTESLQLLHQCITNVPALRNAESELARTYTSYRSPLEEILGRCKDLRTHVAFAFQSRKYGAVAVTAPGRNANSADTVAVFGIELVPVDEKQFVFEVKAASRSALPSYIMDRDGVIHVHGGQTEAVPAPLPL